MKLTLFFHEIKQNRLSLIVWTAVLSVMLGICIAIYPEMQTQMGDISKMFSDMGAFSDAFGMDQLNFGEFMGYFGVECGNTLGIGGALLAAILGISALSKEERDNTSELLLTLPISRRRVVTEKLLFCVFHIFVTNLAIFVVSMLGAVAISADADFGQMALILLSYLLMQIEIMAITFGLSSLLKRGGLGIGIGIGFGFYFMSIIANLSEELEFIKYLTPFGFANSSYIISEGTLEPISLIVGAILAAAGIILAYWQYDRKDIA